MDEQVERRPWAPAGRLARERGDRNAAVDAPPGTGSCRARHDPQRQPRGSGPPSGRRAAAATALGGAGRALEGSGCTVRRAGGGDRLSSRAPWASAAVRAHDQGPRLAATCGRVGAGAGSAPGPDRPVRHFFDLGSTSLSAVTLAIAVNRAVSLEDIAAHPALADMAELLHPEHGEEPPASAEGI